MSSSSLSRPLAGLSVVLMVATCVAVLLTKQGQPTAEAASAMDVFRPAPTGFGQYALTIIDWDTYVRTFNKRYSSVLQMMVRRSLFMTRLYEAFITRLKHLSNTSSYHTTINRYSDATGDEIKMLTEGDSTRLDEKDFTDEQVAGKILDSMRLAQLNRRKKREANFGSLGDDDDGDDDIWSSGPKSRGVMRDIPEERLGLISGENEREKNKLGAIAKKLKSSKALNRVQSIMNVAFDWLANSKKAGPEETGQMMKTVAENKPKQVTVHKDWRDSGCIGMPRDQGYCESCYAFSSTAFAEWAYCVHQEGRFTRLSPQYVINCASRFRANEFAGCNRGPIRLVPDFFREYGLELEENIPYEEETKECHITDSVPRESWGSIRPIVEPTIRMKNNTQNLDKAIRTRPVIMSMFVPKNFVGYGGGFIEDCDPAIGGHAVLLVGSTTEDGADYLIAQNSLGAYWGLQGYFKVKRTPEYLHKCVKHFMVPVMKFSDSSENRAASR